MPAQPPPRPGPPPGRETADGEVPLTPAELAELSELDGSADPADWELDDADPWPGLPDGAQGWLAEVPSPLPGRYPAGRSPAVAEVLAAGFTHQDGAPDGLGGPGGHGPGFAAGGTADALLPGRVLAGLAAQAWRDGLDHLSDDELVGVTLAARRTQSWQAALELAAVTELAGRRDAAAQATGDGRGREHFSQEIAAALTLTGRGAETLLGLATGLGRLGQASGLLAAGVIDRARAVVITDELACLDDRHAAAVAGRVLPRAGELTTGQLRAALRRAVLSADPAAAIRRREKAQKDARVEAWTETAGTAALAGRDLPPAAVLAADRNIDTHARWLQAHGAPGTLPVLRAAAFLALLNSQPPATLLTTLLPDAPGGASGAPAGPAEYPASPDGWPFPPPGGLAGSVHLTMPLTAWTGQDDTPGEAGGLGPQDAGTCRDLGTALTSRPDTRWCLTLTDHHGRPAAHACTRAGPGPPGTDPAAWLASLTIQQLEAGTCSHQRQTPAYRPSATLRHLIKTRNRTCTFPGCRRPAARCDDDHTLPYDQGGRTCECNLAPLCRQHHRAKQAPGWNLTQPHPGTLTWTLPSGRKHTTTPSTYPA